MEARADPAAPVEPPLLSAGVPAIVEHWRLHKTDGAAINLSEFERMEGGIPVWDEDMLLTAEKSSFSDALKAGNPSIRFSIPLWTNSLFDFVTRTYRTGASAQNTRPIDRDTSERFAPSYTWPGNLAHSSDNLYHHIFVTAQPFIPLNECQATSETSTSSAVGDHGDWFFPHSDDVVSKPFTPLGGITARLNKPIQSHLLIFLRPRAPYHVVAEIKTDVTYLVYDLIRLLELQDSLHTQYESQLGAVAGVVEIALADKSCRLAKAAFVIQLPHRNGHAPVIGAPRDASRKLRSAEQQIFAYLYGLLAFHKSTMAFVVLATYKEFCIYWLDFHDASAIAASDSIESLEQILARSEQHNLHSDKVFAWRTPDYADLATGRRTFRAVKSPALAAESAHNLVFETPTTKADRKVTVPLQLCRGPVWDTTTPQGSQDAVRGIASLLQKLSCVRLLDTPLLFDGRPYAKMGKRESAWVTERDIEELDWSTMPSPRVKWLRIIHALGHGADGCVYLAAQCSKVAPVCAVKFPSTVSAGTDRSKALKALKDELRRWKIQLRALQAPECLQGGVRIIVLNDRSALLMPYIPPMNSLFILPAGWPTTGVLQPRYPGRNLDLPETGIVLALVKDSLARLARAGLHHDDLKWAHVGLCKFEGAWRAVFLDLTRAHTTSNPAASYKGMLEDLDILPTEEELLSAGFVPAAPPPVDQTPLAQARPVWRRIGRALQQVAEWFSPRRMRAHARRTGDTV
eukprot:m.105491 g.105491  ORF g.105491 m.105491 type:complete len:743 (-) comp8918_c0_seq3:361-2589(-)